MMKKKTILMAAVLLSPCLALTGCGRSSVNLNDYLTLTSSGYNTVGTAGYTFDYEKMIMDNPKAFGLEENYSEMEFYGVELALDSAFSGSLDKNSDLSNGDTVTFHWDMTDTTEIEEKYPVRLSYADETLTISGLEEAEVIDPFAGVAVSFEGIAPNGTLRISSNDAAVSGLLYEGDKTSGLKNGDTIKITAAAPSGADLNEYLMKNGMIASKTEQEYTVDGLSSYVSAISEIPDDMQGKMKKQAEDTIQANCAGWAEGNFLKSMEFLGFYFLSQKEGFSESPSNEIYCVYQLTSSVTGLYRQGDGSAEETGEETFYTFYRYADAMLLPDGTCSLDLSSGGLCGNSFESDYGEDSGWGFMNWYSYTGYPDLDSMFNDCVTKKIDKYNYETTVK